MSDAISRRKLIRAGLGSAAGVAGLATAARLISKYGMVPPDHYGPYGIGQTLTYASHRILMPKQTLAREFDRSQISSIASVNGLPPATTDYKRMVSDGFADWRLTVDGMVTRPLTLSLADLKSFPARSHITHQACEEGWSFIAESTGVQLSHILNLAGALPQAKYVMFFSIPEKGKPLGGKWGSLDMEDAWHPQTLLAYGMNGKDLPLEHGAPLRVRVPRQLGFKSLKFLTRLTVTDTVKPYGKGWGSSSPERGFSWYGGI